MMINFFIHVLLASCWCFGVKNAFSEGMIFYGKYLDKLPDWLWKPLVGCAMCMASVHGSAWYLIFFGFNWMIVPFVVCLSGLNYVIVNIFSDKANW